MTKYLASSTKGVQTFIILALLGTIAAIATYGLSTNVLLLIFLGYFVYGCLGIVVTFHRKLTHNSYNTHPLLTKVLSIFGCLAGTGSSLAWVAVHINHHLKSDTIDDPHSPNYNGIKIFTLDYIDQVDSKTKWRMRGLITDKFQQILHKYYFLIIGIYSLVLFIIGGFYLMIFLHWAPAVLTAIMSNIVNYAGHKPKWWGGYRTYNLNDQSSNNWIWAIPSWGESWHNNHHRFPKDYTFKKKRWEFDISGLIIRIIKKNI
jgi:stearoyl-CoA desaturase (delta-9 desaturase)